MYTGVCSGEAQAVEVVDSHQRTVDRAPRPPAEIATSLPHGRRTMPPSLSTSCSAVHVLAHRYDYAYAYASSTPVLASRCALDRSRFGLESREPAR